MTEPVVSKSQNPWPGRVLSGLPVLMLTASAIMKLTGGGGIVEKLGAAGIDPQLVPVIGAIELACVLVYAVPRTAVLGALLLTGYLGGAVFAHLRVAESVVAPLVPAALVWAGLYLRDERVRALLPLRR
jgi:hypothetical protein